MARIKGLKTRSAYYVPTMCRKDQLIKINLQARGWQQAYLIEERREDTRNVVMQEEYENVLAKAR